MQLCYDNDFLESAVFLCANGRRSGVPSLQLARFHRARERLYGILDPDERNAAFFQLNLEWFREWGLEEQFTDVVKEFPLLTEHLVLLAIRQTHGQKDEGAELYVNDAGQRSGILALRTNWLTHNGPLTSFLRHEFMHLHDMVNPAFGYAPTLEIPGLNAAQQRIARERYRLLWDITIDGRLTEAGHPPMANREDHMAAFSRGYSFWAPEKQNRVFNSLWQHHHPRHADLLALIADPRGLRLAHRPAPGATCPLCGFSAFHWAETEALSPSHVAQIRAEFPNWLPAEGLCARCLEVYEARKSWSAQHSIV